MILPISCILLLLYWDTMFWWEKYLACDVPNTWPLFIRSSGYKKFLRQRTCSVIECSNKETKNAQISYVITWKMTVFVDIIILFILKLYLQIGQTTDASIYTSRSHKQTDLTFFFSWECRDFFFQVREKIRFLGTLWVWWHYGEQKEPLFHDIECTLVWAT